MRRGSYRWALLVLAAVMVGVLSAVVIPALPAMATSHSGDTTSTYVVDDNPPLESSEDCEADFNKVQSAVEAADPGDTIRVCGGEYDNPVDVATRNLSIRATGGANFTGWDDQESYGFRVRASEVTVSGFILEKPITIKTATNVSVRNSTGSAGIRVRSSATKTRILNNSFSESRILANGSETLLRDNTVRRQETGFPAWVVNVGGAKSRVINNTFEFSPKNNGYETGAWGGWVLEITRGASKTVIRDNTFFGDGTRGVIRSHGNYSEFSGNTIKAIDVAGSGIQVGGENTACECVEDIPVKGTYIRNNIIHYNERSENHGSGIRLREHSHDTTVEKNTITERRHAILIGTNNTVEVLENNISGNDWGVQITGLSPAVVVEENEISNNEVAGVVVGCYDYDEPEYRCDDTSPDPSQVEVCKNSFLFRNDPVEGDEQFAVYNENKSAILNATNNNWGDDVFPGSPTLLYDLKDPKYPDIEANGTGGWISEGAEQGVSNVHFYQPDPKEDPQETPTATPTATPTPTQTPTPTGPSTTTPTPTDNGGAGQGGGPGNGTGSNGSGPGTATGTGAAGSTTDGVTSNVTATPSVTSTATQAATSTAIPSETPPPETPSDTPSATPPPTLTATPEIIPGFGVGVWLVGVVLFVSLLAVRRRD